MNIHRWQENQLVYHHKVINHRPLMLFQFDKQDQLRNEDHKKVINLNITFLNVFTDGIPIFNYCWQNRYMVISEDSIKLFC